MMIQPYTSFFHDGYINEVKQIGSETILFMESAQLDEEDLEDGRNSYRLKNPEEPILKTFPSLTQQETLKGKLHIDGIKAIKKDGAIYNEAFKMLYEDADIFDFKIIENKVMFQIIWGNYNPAITIPPDDAFMVFEIEAEKIWWENTPNGYEYERLVKELDGLIGAKITAINFTDENVLSAEFTQTDENGEAKKWWFTAPGCAWRMERNCCYSTGSGNKTEYIKERITQLDAIYKRSLPDKLIGYHLNSNAFDITFTFDNQMVLVFFITRSDPRENWQLITPDNHIFTAGPSNDLYYK